MAVQHGPKNSKATSKKKLKLPQKRLIRHDLDYFTFPKPIWMIIMLAGIWFLVTLTLSPGSIPSYFGPVATFGRYMRTTYPNLCIYLCAFTLIVHSLQAAYAGKVCHLPVHLPLPIFITIYSDRGMTTSATIKWVLSTFLFGFPSLMFQLLPHNPTFKTS